MGSNESNKANGVKRDKPGPNAMNRAKWDQMGQFGSKGVKQDKIRSMNEAKSNYLIFSRFKESFATGLSISSGTLDRINMTKILGIWISEDLSWLPRSRSSKEGQFKTKSNNKIKICWRDIYILFIQSVTEYCAVCVPLQPNTMSQ